MAQRPRKSSACVTLVLIGAAALAGCGDSPGRRAAYPSKEACLADWGDPKECEEQPRSASSATRSWGPSSGTWHSYSSGRSRSSSSSSSGSGSHSVSRGGFGSHGSSAS
jgi:uncharacterized protein YgiB involved in biofilm formation